MSSTSWSFGVNDHNVVHLQGENDQMLWSCGICSNVVLTDDALELLATQDTIRGVLVAERAHDAGQVVLGWEHRLHTPAVRGSTLTTTSRDSYGWF